MTSTSHTGRHAAEHAAGCHSPLQPAASDLEHLERVIAESEAGRYELHYFQQPPFGFFSATYLGEIAVCVPLFDPQARLEALKRRVADYPEALRQAVGQGGTRPQPLRSPRPPVASSTRRQGDALIRLIKAWARAEGRRDADIFDLHNNPSPSWPWLGEEQLARLTENAPSMGPGTNP